MADEIGEIEKLAELRDKGLITEAEFQAKKRQLLNGTGGGESLTEPWDSKTFWKRIGVGLVIPVAGWVIGAVNLFRGRKRAGQALVVLLVSLAAAGVYYAALSGVTAGDPQIVSMVKDGTLSAYPDRTIGEAVEGFFANPRWEHIVAEDGNDYVNVRGRISYAGEPADAVVQYAVDPETGSFQVNAFEINGLPQNELMYLELVAKMYE